MCRYCVATYAQNLSIFLLKPAMVLPEEGSLRGSTRCEVEHVERENHVLLTLIAAKGDVPFANRRKGKVGGCIANLCRHILTFLHRFFGLVSKSSAWEIIQYIRVLYDRFAGLHNFGWETV